MRRSAEGTETLQDLCGILRFVQVNGEKDIMRLQSKRRVFAGFKEQGDILHLYEWHYSLGFKSQCIWRSEINESIEIED
jgi:hypothetical protein